MDLGTAIMKSDCGIAERISPRNLLICALQTRPGELRIIKSFTDPTVVRRLRANELLSVDWYPVNKKEITYAKRK